MAFNFFISNVEIIIVPRGDWEACLSKVVHVTFLARVPSVRCMLGLC